MSINDISNFIKTKFAEQKAKATVAANCPHCGKPIDFKFEHTQHTVVETTMVGIVKKGEPINGDEKKI